MPQSKISAALTATDKQAIITAIQTIKTKLPFLVNLNDVERKKLRKMGAVRTGYVQEVFYASSANTTSLPSGFDMVEYNKDFNIHKELREIHSLLGPVAEGIGNTLMAAGSDLMLQSDECYGHLKVAAKKSPNQSLTNAGQD